MIGLVTRSLPADITRERPRTTMHFHMFGQIITPVEGFTALGHFTHILLRHFMFPYVTLAIVLSNELTSAVITCVGTNWLVSVHMWNVISMSYEGALTEVAFEGFRWPAQVRPAMKFQVPFCRKRFVAYNAVVRTFTAVCQQVGTQVGSEVYLKWNRNYISNITLYKYKILVSQC